MKFPSRILSVLFLTVGYILVVSVDRTFACSGGFALTIEGLLENSDYLVKAHVAESDDLNQNSILEVESYLAGGSGPQHILLQRTDPIRVGYIRAGRSSGGDCLGMFPPLDTHSSFYAFIGRVDDGSYRLVRGFFNPAFYAFPNREATAEVFPEGSYRDGDQNSEYFAERGSGQEVTESEFIDIIASISEEEAKLPDLSSRYPLKAPVLIKTQSEQYILPVDWQSPYSVPENGLSLDAHPMYHWGFSDALRCSDAEEQSIHISPDEQNIAVVFADDIICFTWGYTVEGQSVLFSNTSDSVAVWNECVITVYSSGYPRLGQQSYQIREISQQEVQASVCENSHLSAVWNHQGNTLAYTDNAGIWLWDIQSKERYLIVPNEDNTETLTPNHFSPLGRYLNYSTADTRKHIDIYSGEILPHGLFSPDEQLLINYESEPTAQGYEICSRFSFSECIRTGMMYITFIDEETGEVDRVYNPDDIRISEWTSDSSFIQLSCASDTDDICGVFRWYPDYHGWNTTLVDRGTYFDYHAKLNQLVIVQSDSTILIDSYEVDLLQEINGRIIEANWLPSIFYYD